MHLRRTRLAQGIFSAVAGLSMVTAFALAGGVGQGVGTVQADTTAPTLFCQSDTATAAFLTDLNNALALNTCLANLGLSAGVVAPLETYLTLGALGNVGAGSFPLTLGNGTIVSGTVTVNAGVRTITNATIDYGSGANTITITGATITSTGLITAGTGAVTGAIDLGNGVTLTGGTFTLGPTGVVTITGGTLSFPCATGGATVTVNLDTTPTPGTLTVGANGVTLAGAGVTVNVGGTTITLPADTTLSTDAITGATTITGPVTVLLTVEGLPVTVTGATVGATGLITTGTIDLGGGATLTITNGVAAFTSYSTNCATTTTSESSSTSTSESATGTSTSESSSSSSSAAGGTGASTTTTSSSSSAAATGSTTAATSGATTVINGTTYNVLYYFPGGVCVQIGGVGNTQCFYVNSGGTVTGTVTSTASSTTVPLTSSSSSSAAASTTTSVATNLGTTVINGTTYNIVFSFPGAVCVQIGGVGNTQCFSVNNAGQVTGTTSLVVVAAHANEAATHLHHVGATGGF